MDQLEGRLAIFCLAATTNAGSMPPVDDIKTALGNSDELIRLANALETLEAPQGALAVANDAADIGAAVRSMLVSALVITGDLDAGAVEPAAAEAVYIQSVIDPCDDLFDQIDELREAADVLE